MLHLEEKCDRAIEWALKIEPSIKHLVCEKHISILIELFNFLEYTLFFFVHHLLHFCSLPVTSLVYDTDKLIHLGGLWRRCFQQPCEGSA